MDPSPNEKTVLTFSAMNAFRNCPCKYRYRYLDRLRPIQRADSLAFGSVIHGGLELWYKNAASPDRFTKLLDYIDQAFPKRGCDENERANWQRARAMLVGYVARYPEEEFEILAVEHEFSCEIRNPDTDATSRAFSLAGKVDGIVLRRDGKYLLEHKTASHVDAQYLDKLWTDTQIHLYSLALRGLGYDIRGIIYSVLLKTRLQQRQGETESEFEERRLALAAKNKTGKSSAKRQEPETDEEFQGRLAAWHADPGAYHREVLLVDQMRLRMVAEEMWDITRQMLYARCRNRYLCNTSFCFAWQRPCGYLPLCQSGGNPALFGNLYEVADPNEELPNASLDF